MRINSGKLSVAGLPPDAVQNFLKLLVSIFLILGCIRASKAQTTQGTDFWLTPMMNIGGVDSFFVIVSAEKATTATIEIPLLSFNTSLSLGYNDLVKVFIPATYKPSTTDAIISTGIHVTSKLPVSVYSLSARSATTDASCIFPSAVLPQGGEYYVPTPVVYNSMFNSDNLIGIVCVDDSTTVEIIPKANTTGGFSANAKSSIKMKQGQVYIVTSASKVGLEGTWLKAGAGKRIAVFSGDKCISIRCVACDHIYEEIPPVTTWGKTFVTTPFYKQDKGHDYQVVASENGTIVKENGSTRATLNAGETFYRKVYGDSSHCITANKPILLLQYMIGKNCGATIGGDPSMLVINPLEQTINYAVVSTSNTTLVKTHFINIVVPKKGVDSVYLDGALLPATDFDTLSCGDYFLYSDSISAGNHNIQCREGFICYLYGIGSYESYAYSAGSGLRNLKRYIVGKSYPSCDSGFIVKLTSKGDSATQFRWTFDKTQYDTSVNPYFNVKKPGVYPVKLLYKLLGNSTWDSTNYDILVEKPEFSDFIPFDSLTVCDTSYRIQLPNTPIFSYLWGTGDTTAFLDVNKTNRYKVNITNRVTGCKSADSCKITFQPAVYARMNYYMSMRCPGIPLYLNDSSIVPKTDSVISYSWYADKTLLSSQKNDIIKSPSANNYEIKLLIQTKNGCKDSADTRILVSDIPKAGLGVVKYDSCFRTNSFRFNNNSKTTLGKISRYKWIFGDGDTSNKMTITRSYKDSGIYQVRLIAYSETGCFDTSSALNIKVYPAPSPVILTSDSAICLTGNYFNFKNGTPDNGVAKKFLWDWGDGTGSTFENPGVIPFQDTGTYRIKFIPSYVKTGCGDTAFKTIRILTDPKASVVLDSWNFCLNNNYYDFTSNSNPGGGKTVNYTWKWGNGVVVADTTGKMRVVYSKSGSYKVKMIYSTGKGCIDSVSKNVIIYDAPTAAFTLADSNLCGDKNFFDFRNNSIAPSNAKYFWNYGDGTTDQSKQPSPYSYSGHGTFQMSLAVKDPLTGCTDTAFKTLNVLKAPLLDIRISDTAVCIADSAFVFTDSTKYGNLLAQRLWEFPSGQIDTNQTVKWKFTSHGFYKVRFSSGLQGVCADTTESTIHVRYSDTPVIVFTELQSLCLPGLLTLKAEPASGTNWQFVWKETGSGKTWNLQEVDDIFIQNAGNSKYELTATDDIGCSFVQSRIITVLPPPVVHYQLTGNDTQCLRGNTFELKSTVSNVVYPVKYVWNCDGITYNDSSTGPVIFTTAGNKIAKIRITDNNGCKDSGELKLTVLENPELTVFNDSGCTGELAELIARFSGPWSDIKSVVWYRNGQQIYTGNTYKQILSSPGIETFYAVAEGKNGCLDTSSNIMLISFARPVAGIGYKMHTATALGIQVDFYDSSTGENQWYWQLIPGITTTAEKFSYTYNEPGKVKVRLIVGNGNGCLDTADRDIFLVSNEYGWVPTTFTPDGNNVNDVFRVEGLSAVSFFEMSVYNRWGQKLFETNDPVQGWDGTYMGESVPQGVYSYYINTVFLTGKRQVWSGNVTVLK